MYVCTYDVCMCVCMYVCTYDVCMYVCMYYVLEWINIWENLGILQWNEHKKFGYMDQKWDIWSPKIVCVHMLCMLVL